MIASQSQNDRYQLQDAQIRWLASTPFNFTLTLHYHQRWHDEWITPERATETVNHFMNKIDRVLLGRPAQKKGEFLPRATFHEFDFNNRLHTHLLLQCNATSSDLLYGCAKASARMKWIDRRVYVEPIDADTQMWLISYCHKNGLQAFCPEATRLPTQDKAD